MIVTLKSEGYQITVNTLGAELKSFKNPSGKEFIWNGDPAFWARSSPLLFPAIGNVRNNKTVIAGREYPMPKHGFCKDMEFVLLTCRNDFAVFSLRANEESLKYYPYLFELQLSYKLDRNKLAISYKVSNKSEDIMYYHIGAHPGFICPLESGKSLKDYVLQFDRDENIKSIVYDMTKLCFSSSRTGIALEGNLLPLSADMFDNDAIYFRHTNSHGVSLINPSTAKGVHLSYPDFSSIAIWTPAGGAAPFVCLEPWNGAAIFDDEDDIFCHKRDIQALMPEKETSYRLEISLMGY